MVLLFRCGFSIPDEPLLPGMRLTEAWKEDVESAEQKKTPAPGGAGSDQQYGWAGWTAKIVDQA